MRVPLALSHAFEQPFEDLLARFLQERKLIASPQDLTSPRFLSRSILPHLEKLSSLFNRLDDEQDRGLGPYWQKSSNPENFRLAYFLSFMPPNLYRMASVWCELGRLGFRWSPSLKTLRGIELGAGPASGACGIAAGENFAKLGIPEDGNWALLEQDRAMLRLGTDWASAYFQSLSRARWGIRPFHRRLELDRPLLPSTAPRFNLWVMSYFLNESELPIETVADTLLQSWRDHLEEEGLVILIEPALKAQSRRILELRRSLLRRLEKDSGTPLQVLLPCLGHQSCGALQEESDWCHEEVTWWRPPYFRKLDQMASLDRKTLPFSYLVLAKSRRPREELLPALASVAPSGTRRLVSPAHSEGRDLEFFICGQDGKRRARFRTEDLERGDILVDTELKGDPQATRIQSARKISSDS